jgi:ribosomal protein S18 acetylase RimI-like enzyme
LSFVAPLVSNATVDGTEKGIEQWILTEPQSEADWVSYFDLRWRVLRAEWNQPRGSERDDQEDQSMHQMLCDASRRAVAVGRLHLRSPTEAQIRYMAVDPALSGRGFGGRILRELERRALAAGVKRIVLNARKGAVAFYRKHGYAIAGPGETLFGAIEHVRMEKDIAISTPQ